MPKLRSLRQLAEAEVEPVSLADAKAQVGLLPEQEDDHALLLRLISTGRRLVEQRLGVTLATRQFRATFEPAEHGHCHGHDHYHQHYTYYQGSRRLGLRIPVPPLLVDGTHPLAITVGGVAVNPATYTVDADSTPAVIRFTTWPTFDDDTPLVVTFWAGPAPGQQIEAGLESVILLFVAHWYKNREAVLTGTIAVALPAGCETLLAAHSVTGAW